MDLTRRLREISGEGTTRIKSQLAAKLERALLDQSLRCYPSLAETPAGNVRVFRASSTVADLIDSVAVPSPNNDRVLAEAVTKIKGKWDHSREQSVSPRTTAAEMVRSVLPRDRHLEYVNSLQDSDLATT